jgi:hypothetical protein
MESTSRKTEYACVLDKFVVKEMIWVTNVMQLELEMLKRLEMLEEIA